jgi:hypothetical protein
LYAKRLCKIKQTQSHIPKYWNGLFRSGESALKNIANIGIESEKTIEVLKSSPYLGLSPIGLLHGEYLNNSHPT